jgi:chemotaxis response regulator CheB
VLGFCAPVAKRIRASAVISVLLAEDQTIVRRGFRALIDAEPDMKVLGESLSPVVG